MTGYQSEGVNPTGGIGETIDFHEALRERAKNFMEVNGLQVMGPGVVVRVNPLETTQIATEEATETKPAESTNLGNPISGDVFEVRADFLATAESEEEPELEHEKLEVTVRGNHVSSEVSAKLIIEVSHVEEDEVPSVSLHNLEQGITSPPQLGRTMMAAAIRRLGIPKVRLDIEGTDIPGEVLDGVFTPEPQSDVTHPSFTFEKVA